MNEPYVGGERYVASEALDEVTLAAFNTDCPESNLVALGEALGDYLDIENVTVGATLTDDQPGEFAVLHDAVLIDGSLVYPGRDGDAIDAAASAFHPTDTLFLAGYDDREGLRGLSQRIETLAWRTGAGRLYVSGQQRLAMMDDQWGLYASIADNGTEVHVFENPDYVPGDANEFVLHDGRHSLSGTWLVAFDGDGNDAAKGALLAAEREPDTYYGVWTVEPELVDQILLHVVEDVASERGRR